MAGNFVNTYGDVSIKEDVVLNAVEILTAKETQLSNILPKTRAIAPVHSYLQDTLRTAASAGVTEEADYSPAGSTTPTRKTNVVEHMAIAFKVSGLQQAVDHYHGENELERQTRKALMDFGNALEFDLVRSTLASGASGTAPKMDGIIRHISKSTNYTAHTSGTTFNASHLEGLMAANWSNSNGETATDVFMSAGMRTKLDQATQKSNVVVNQANGITDIVKMTSTYTTAFGKVQVHTHRYVLQTADATDRILGVNRNKLAVAWLRMPFIDTGVARSGDYQIRAIVGDATLEVKSEDSNFFSDGFIK